MKWKPVSEWNCLPVGLWLVKMADKRVPYAVADCFLNAQGRKTIVVGGRFAFDCKPIEAYSEIEAYATSAVE